MNPRFRDGLRRYAIAVVVVLLTVAIKLLFFGLGSEHPFVLLPAAVAVAAWYGGLGPGVLATGLVVIESVFFLLPPVGSGAEAADLVAMGGLVVESAVVVALTVGLRAARIRADSARAASAAAHREAAFALAVRDEMLTVWARDVRAPVADVELQARAALEDLVREGYAGAAGPRIRKLMDEAQVIGRVSRRWGQERDPTA
ncbi:MAG TPA: DUF4118 domain-containing protein [Candidatus Limnocylindria bacterium]